MAKKALPKLNTVAVNTGIPHEMQVRFIDDFLNTEVKDYAHYVVTTRALPNIMDGLKVGGRKIMWAGINGDLKKYKKIKMVDMIGDTMKYEFHHGDSSLKNTIEQFASDHLFETAPFRVIGQKGTLRVPDAKTAARYLEVALTEYINIFKTDTELLQLNFEDGKITEPKHFLPIVPIVLLWRTNSPGFGFSFRSFSYKLEDIIDATMCAVINGSCSGLWHIDLKPRIKGIDRERMVYNEAKAAWYNIGEYQINADVLTVTDLPYNVSYKKYTVLLNELKEKGTILDWFNRKSKTEPIKYVISFPKDKLKVLYNSKWKFYGMFRLYAKVPKQTLNVIDKDGKTIINFDNANDFVDGFGRRRLLIYNQRKTRQISIIEKAIADLTDKAQFIQLVVDDKIIVTKRAKADIEADCLKFGVTTAGLQLEIYRLTLEEIAKALKRIGDLKIELEYIRSTSIQTMYLNDLIELRQKTIGIKNGMVKKQEKIVNGILHI
jgi:DNA topoisomerase-2